MKNSSAFSFSRFFRLLRNEFWLVSNGIWAIFGILLFILIILVAAGDFENDDLPFHQFMYASMVLFGFFISAAAFKELHKEEESYLWLALPGSLLEKYLCRLVLTSLGYFIVASIAYALFALALNTALAVIYGMTVTPLNPFSSFALKCLAIYLVGHSFIFAGAAYFRQLSYAIVIFIVYNFFVYGLVTTMIDGSAAKQLAVALLVDRMPVLLAAAPLNWSLGYHLLKKVEV